MNKIERNTDPLKGPPDGVMSEISCVITQFDRVDGNDGTEKGFERVISGQATMPCNIVCSYSEGTVGFSVRDIDLMLHVRIDEMFEIFKAAAAASEEFKATLPPEMAMINPPTPDDPGYQEYTDEVVEELWRELEDIPFDEADSPHGLILAQPWLHFTKGVDRGDIWEWFDAMHSKGVAHLMGQDD